MYTTYILYAAKFDRYGIGHCADMQVRLEKHNAGMVPSTKAYLPWEIVYSEEYLIKEEAFNREFEIKRKKC